jgi:hypothetical protein
MIVWRLIVSKNASGTGAFGILVKHGTGKSTSDTTFITITLPASTAAVDVLTMDLQVIFTSSTAGGYLAGVTHYAATGAGFGIAVATPAYAGTFSAITIANGDSIGLAIVAAAGGTMATPVIGLVRVNAYNLD